MVVKPLCGLRPRADLAARIPSRPYDVLDSHEARQLARDDPYTFLHVIKPEIDLEPGIDPHDPRVYDKAAENFRGMIDSGWLVQDDRPSYYVYRLSTADHVQTGIVGAASVKDYVEGRIKKHELTREDKETDRTRHMDALSAHPGPVFTSHRPSAALREATDEARAGDPEVDFEADGVRHQLWVVGDAGRSERIESAFAEMPASYIADGHHRAASAARVAARRNDLSGDSSGSGAHDYFLTVHFPSDQVRVLDYNRVVRDLNGLDKHAFLQRLRDAGFRVTPGYAGRRPEDPGAFGMHLDGEWYRLDARDEWIGDPDPVDSLSVAILADHVLGPVLGIEDVRTDPRIDFVGGSRGMEELERRVRDGEAAVAFAVYPTSIDAVMRVADSGRTMPPKSTWFDPKLRSGMVVHLF